METCSHSKNSLFSLIKKYKIILSVFYWTNVFRKLCVSVFAHICDYVVCTHAYFKNNIEKRRLNIRLIKKELTLKWTCCIVQWSANNYGNYGTSFAHFRRPYGNLKISSISPFDFLKRVASLIIPLYRLFQRKKYVSHRYWRAIELS